MISILDENFFKNPPKNYILYFYANWIPKSIGGHMYRLVSKIETEFNLPAFGIDVDTFKTYIKIYNLDKLPTILLFSNFECIKRIEGYILITAFRTVIRDMYKDSLK